MPELESESAGASPLIQHRPEPHRPEKKVKFFQQQDFESCDKTQLFELKNQVQRLMKLLGFDNIQNAIAHAENERSERGLPPLDSEPVAAVDIRSDLAIQKTENQAELGKSEESQGTVTTGSSNPNPTYPPLKPPQRGHWVFGFAVPDERLQVVYDQFPKKERKVPVDVSQKDLLQTFQCVLPGLVSLRTGFICAHRYPILARLDPNVADETDVLVITLADNTVRGKTRPPSAKVIADIAKVINMEPRSAAWYKFVY